MKGRFLAEPGQQFQTSFYFLKIISDLTRQIGGRTIAISDGVTIRPECTVSVAFWAPVSLRSSCRRLEGLRRQAAAILFSDLGKL